MKRLFPLFLWVVVALSIPGIAYSQQYRSIDPDCCFQIYGTGRWLGWAASLLEYTRIRTRPVVYDQAIINCLNKAIANVEAANLQCGSRLQAWPGWRQKQNWLRYLIRKLQTPSTASKSHRQRRVEVWRSIEQAYGTWADALSIQVVDGRALHQMTCSTCYFRLGFDTACAAQAFRQAEESFRYGRDNRAIQQLHRAQGYLERAQKALRDYRALQRRLSFSVRCVNLDALRLEERMQRISRNISLNKYNYGPYMDDAIRLSDDIVPVLRRGCTAGGNGNGNGLFSPGSGSRSWPGRSHADATRPGEGNTRQRLWQILRRRQYGAPPNCYEFYLTYVGSNRVSAPGVLTPLAVREGWQIDNQLGAGSGPGGTWRHRTAADSRLTKLSTYGGDLYGCRKGLRQGTAHDSISGAGPASGAAGACGQGRFVPGSPPPGCYDCVCKSNDGRNGTCQQHGCVEPPRFGGTCYWDCYDAQKNTIWIRGRDGAIIRRGNRMLRGWKN